MSNSEFDPNNIEPYMELNLRLPRVITAHDYHDFGYIKSLLTEDLGIEGVYVTEVGFDAPDFVALIHTDCESHNQLVMELENYYQMLEKSK